MLFILREDVPSLNNVHYVHTASLIEPHDMYFCADLAESALYLCFTQLPAAEAQLNHNSRLFSIKLSGIMTVRKE